MKFFSIAIAIVCFVVCLVSHQCEANAYLKCDYFVYHTYEFETKSGEQLLTVNFGIQDCKDGDPPYYYYEFFNHLYKKLEFKFTIYYENGENTYDTQIMNPRERNKFDCIGCEYRSFHTGRKVSGFQLHETIVVDRQ